MTSYLDKPLRTPWEAARDLLELAITCRNAALWDRGYRLWVWAAASRAPGQPFELGPYMARWLP